MAIREVPRREAKLNDAYTTTPPAGTPAEVVGIRAFVTWRISKGDDVAELSARFLKDNGIKVPAPTLYKWIQRWKSEELAQKPNRKRTRKPETAEPETVSAA